MSAVEIKAMHRFARISPKKARVVAKAIVGKRVDKAIALLTSTPRRAAVMIVKVLKSAAANAENNQAVECDPEEMYVTAATIDGGPSLKRHKFGARARIMPRRRRMSHITVCLSEKSEEKDED